MGNVLARKISIILIAFFVALMAGFSGLAWADEDASGAPALISTYSGDDSEQTYVSTASTDDVLNNTFFIKKGSKAVDVKGSSKANKANALLSAFKKKMSQKWGFLDAGDGYYYIVSANSGKALTVLNSKKKSGTNVIQYALKGVASQKWAVLDNGDGTYSFVSALANLALSSTSKSNLVVKSFSGSPTSNQKFTFAYAKLFADGVYSITPRSDTSRALCVPNGSKKANTQMSFTAWDSRKSEKFDFFETGRNANTFYIRAAQSGLYLAIERSGKVVQVDAKNKQAWKAVVSSSGLSFVNASGARAGRTMAASKNRAVSTASFDPCKAVSQFVVTRTPLFEDGCYTMHFGSEEGKIVVGVKESSTKENANVLLNAYNNTSGQKFDFTHVGGGVYKIVGHVSGLALSVNENGSVVQAGDGSAKAEQWIARVTTGGSVILVNRATGLAINSGGKVADGTNANTAKKSDVPRERLFVVPADAVLDYQQRAIDKANKRGSNTNWYFVVNITNHRTLLLHRDSKESSWYVYKDWICTTGQVINGVSKTRLGDGAIRGRLYRLADSNGTWYSYYCTSTGLGFFHEYVHYSWGVDRRMGRSISGGCVRLQLDNAIWVYNNNKMLRGSGVTVWK